MFTAHAVEMETEGGPNPADHNNIWSDLRELLSL